MVIFVMRCTYLLTKVYTVYMNENVLHVHDNEFIFVICVNLEMFMEHWN